MSAKPPPNQPNEQTEQIEIGVIKQRLFVIATESDDERNQISASRILLQYLIAEGAAPDEDSLDSILAALAEE